MILKKPKKPIQVEIPEPVTPPASEEEKALTAQSSVKDFKSSPKKQPKALDEKFYPRETLVQWTDNPKAIYKGEKFGMITLNGPPNKTLSKHVKRFVYIEDNAEEY